MPNQPLLPPLRPHVAWRVGITGHRDLSAASVPGLRSAVASILELVGNTVRNAATGDVAAETYAATGTLPSLRLLSPLADGADRLVAEEALAKGYRLEVALPFARAEYEQDFDSESVAQFRTLLDQAGSAPGDRRVIAIDGSQAGLSERGYETVGRFVLRNCDLLVAVWDGQPASGRGGTAEIVRAAVAAGLPVWWIDPATPDTPRLLEEGWQPSHPAPLTDGPAPEAALVRYIREVITPPEVEHPHRHGSMGRLIHHACSVLGRHPSPLEDYLREEPAGRAWMRGVYGCFMRLVAPVPASEERAVLRAEGEVEQWWERHYATATLLSNMYGDLYRSSYVLVFFLAGIALLAAILALAVPPSLHVAVACVELAALTGIALLVGANHLHRWQERWIQYRLFAELCRAQRVLAPLGWTLPVRDIARITATAPHHGVPPGAQAPPRDAWVAWYFAANRRACPMPTGMLSGPVLARARAIGMDLVEEQRAYHQARETRSQMAGRRLAHWGDLFFVVALVGVTLRIGMELMHAPALAVSLLGVVCGVSPAASATLLGIRAYAEFDLLARQSARMQRIMADAARELDALTFDGPLASNDLGSALFGVTAAMLLDIDGWAQLFRVKAVEAG